MAPRGRPTRTTRARPVTATPPPVTTTPPPVTDPTTTTSVTGAQLQAMIDEGVTAVLAARAMNREGAVNLTQWFERMETVFRISNCTVENQVKFATCTLMGTALTWWNSHARTVTNEVAYAMTWSDLKKKMTTKYCPRNEIKKIEVELWNLKVQGTDVVAYNQRFQELALLSDRMFPEETDKIERYVGGMPDSIYSSVVASKPKTMQEAIEMATELMDRRNNTLAERQAENKRKIEDTPRNNQTQQPNKRQNTGRAYAAGNGDRRPYEGAKPRCPKCNFNHYGPCTPSCTNCKKPGHLAKDCRSRPATANNNNRNNNNNNNRNNNNNNNRNNNNQRAQGANTNAIVCFECGAPGHFRNNCPQWKNKNQGNGSGVARAYVAGQNPDNNVVTGTFLLNNRCASILFDTGADRSFVSTDMPRSICFKDVTYFGTITVKEAEENKSRKKAMQDVPIVKNFPRVFSRGLARSSTYQTSGISHRSCPRCCTCSRDLINWPPSEMKELAVSTTRASIKGLYKLVRHFGAPVSIRQEKEGSLRTNFKGRVSTEDQTLRTSKSRRHSEIIIGIVEKEELYAKFSKCEFGFQIVQFLGHVIDNKAFMWRSQRQDRISFKDSPKTNDQALIKEGQFEWGDQTGIEEAGSSDEEKLGMFSAPILALPEAKVNDFIE
ncbi:reverse transcriptase domain-containing protein [Tanacetum coccineum]